MDKVAQMVLNFVEDKIDVNDNENVEVVENAGDFMPEVNAAKSVENAFCLTIFSVEFSLVDGAQTYILKSNNIVKSDIVVWSDIIVWTSLFVEFFFV